LKIQKEFTDDQQVKIIAEFEADLLETYKHRAARKLASKTKIPGFRPGKAPYGVIIAQLGELAVTQEAIDLMLDGEYPKVIDEAEIKPFGPGSLEKIESENPPIFHFSVPLEPEVELADYTGLRKDYDPQPFDEQKVEDYLLRVRRNSATIVPLETPAEEGNVVFLSLHAESDDKEDNVLVDKEPQQVLIPTAAEDNISEWPFKGFARKLIGHKADEDVVITHKFPKTHEDEQFKGKKVTFTATIQSVKGLELPELEGEFLESLGNYESAEQFKEAVRAHLQKDEQVTYDDAYYLDLADQIRQAATIKYPPQMLDEEIDKVFHRVEADIKRSNLDMDTYFKMRQTDKQKFIEEELKPTAILRLERSLVMDAFAKKQSIQLNEERLKSEMDQILTELIMDGNLKEIQKEMGNEKFANAITMEAANRQMEKEIRRHLKSIATETPLVEEEQTPVIEEQPTEEVADEAAPVEAETDAVEPEEAAAEAQPDQTPAEPALTEGE